MNFKTLSFLTLLAFCFSAHGIEDSQENRNKQALRYLQATPVSDLLDDMANSMAQNLPPEQRQKFINVMTEHVDAKKLENVMLQGMVSHFTAEELSALADFYGSPVGKSAMAKFGGYMAQTMPQVQAEVMRAVGEAMKTDAAANRKKPDLVEN